jgi:secondary thiamine-phosphate synthase enzyme
VLHTLAITTRGRGLHGITHQVQDAVAQGGRQAGQHDGVCTVFVQHTSASLLIQENADPSAARDLER